MRMVSEVMTRDVRFVSPQENVQRAAQLMDEWNVGVLPVCDNDRLIGIVTDRDIAIRACAAGKAPQDAHVDEVMSTNVRWVFEDQPIDDVMVQMADSQIRRVPVVTHDDAHRLVGIVALGDIATSSGDVRSRDDMQDVMAAVSTPSEPTRPQGEQVDQRLAGGGLPNAGESGIGVAGASGTSAPDGNSETLKRTTGVGGGDLQGDGLPPH